MKMLASDTLQIQLVIIINCLGRQYRGQIITIYNDSEGMKINLPIISFNIVSIDKFQKKKI